ncbi:(+)-neomenthol dehydrogenase-like protein, partial [Tanacetum coccineum]
NEVYDENAHLLTKIIEQPHHLGEECIKTNYYGTKRVTEAFLPLLELSKSPRIVNVSSNYGELQYLPNEKLQNELQDIEHLTEERIDEIIQWFLRDLEANKLLENGWPLTVGYVITDITSNTGELTSEEGAKAPVMVALLPDDGPLGVYFKQMQISPF